MRNGQTVGLLEALVLASVSKLGPSHAYGIKIHREACRVRGGNTIAPNAVYVTLDRLKKKGLVTAEARSETPLRGSCLRKYYRLSADGIASLESLRQQLSAITAVVELGERETVFANGSAA